MDSTNKLSESWELPKWFIQVLDDWPEFPIFIDKEKRRNPLCLDNKHICTLLFSLRPECWDIIDHKLGEFFGKRITVKYRDWRKSRGTLVRATQIPLEYATWWWHHGILMRWKREMDYIYIEDLRNWVGIRVNGDWVKWLWGAISGDVDSILYN